MSDIETFITSAIAESCCTDPEKLDPQTQLIDLGLDSLVITSLVSLIEAAYSVELSPEQVLELYEAATLGEMVSTVSRLVPAGSAVTSLPG